MTTDHFTHTHILQQRTEDGWRDLQGFVSQDLADLRCEQLQASSEATGTGREFRVLSWLPTLTPAQLSEGDACEERR